MYMPFLLGYSFYAFISSSNTNLVHLQALSAMEKSREVHGATEVVDNVGVAVEDGVPPAVAAHLHLQVETRNVQPPRGKKNIIQNFLNENMAVY